jgi:hypothetical protein
MTKPVSRKLAVDCLLDRFERAMGGLPCPVCGAPLLPGQKIQFDHIHADVFDGPHEYQNLRPIHYDPCHKKKSGQDIAANAKVKRLRGETCTGPSKQIPSRPFQKGHREIQSRGFQSPHPGYSYWTRSIKT